MSCVNQLAPISSPIIPPPLPSPILPPPLLALIDDFCPGKFPSSIMTKEFINVKLSEIITRWQQFQLQNPNDPKVNLKFATQLLNDGSLKLLHVKAINTLFDEKLKITENDLQEIVNNCSPEFGIKSKFPYSNCNAMTDAMWRCTD